nr:F-box protein CPR1-like [Ipomoea batatas]
MIANRRKMSGHFPEDVLISILSRLPVATVLRCTAVCKSWYALISSPLFISTHFQFNSAKTHLLLRYCDEDRVLDKKENYNLYFDDNDTFEVYRKFEFPFIGVNDYFRIVGSCNGLVCLTDDMGEYNLTTILWNPSIRKSVVLPEPRVTFTSNGACSHTHGFGFDPLTNEYKVVRIVNIWLNDGPPQVELYELSKGRWRDISHAASGFRYRVGATAPAAFARGILHWAAMDENFRNVILWFDMSKEVFGEISLPESLASASLRYFTDLRVGMYKESLAVFVHGTYSMNPYCCVWIMEEYGNVRSWTQLFSINHLRLGFQLLVGFRQNGEALFVDRDKCFAIFDPKALVIEYLDIHGSYLHAFYASTYTESLVFMDKIEWSDTNTVRDLLLKHSIEDDADQCTHS